MPTENKSICLKSVLVKDLKFRLEYWDCDDNYVKLVLEHLASKKTNNPTQNTPKQYQGIKYKNHKTSNCSIVF